MVSSVVHETFGSDKSAGRGSLVQAEEEKCDVLRFVGRTGKWVGGCLVKSTLPKVGPLLSKRRIVRDRHLSRS